MEGEPKIPLEEQVKAAEKEYTEAVKNWDSIREQIGRIQEDVSEMGGDMYNFLSEMEEPQNQHIAQLERDFGDALLVAIRKLHILREELGKQKEAEK